MLKPRVCLLNAPKRIRLSCPPACLPSRAGSRQATTEVASPAAPAAAESKSTAIAPPPMRREANAMRTYKPITPGVRHLRRPVNDHLWKGHPFRKLTFVKKGQTKGGRNHTGQIVNRHRGGGHRRRIRTVDFTRRAGGRHKVERIEYDPNRSAHLALLVSEATGDKSYIIAADGMRAGDTVESFLSGIPEELQRDMGGSFDPGLFAMRTSFRGNCLPVRLIPIGTQVYNVGSRAKKVAVFCRSAGTFAMVVSKDLKKKNVTVRLQSGEVRTVDEDACATIGMASNPFHHFAQLGKAGRSRWLNIRPHVRGVAMNAADHPHGGGRGKSKGNVHPRSIWGTPAKSGFKTRKKRHPNKFLVKERPRMQGRRKDKNK